MHILQKNKLNEFFLNRLIILLLAFFLGLGKIAYSSEGLSIVPVLVVVFIMLSFLNINKVAINFLNIKSILLFLLVITLGISEVVNFNILYSIDLINFKLIIAILFFIILTDYLTRDKGFRDIMFLSFSLGVIVLLIISLIFSDIGYYYKGKYMIVDENPNSTGTRFALAAVFLCYFVLDGIKNKLYLVFSLALFLILTYFTILTGSRGSLIFLIVSSLILVFYSENTLLFKMLIITSSIILSLIGFGLLLNMEGDIGQKWSLAAEGDLAGRNMIWDVALNIFYDNPFMGVGHSQYLYYMESAIGSAKDAHNLFVFLLATGGIVAFTLYNLFFLYLLNKAIKARHYDRGLRLALWLCILILALKTGGALVYLVLWFLYAIIDSQHYVQKRVI